MPAASMPCLIYNTIYIIINVVCVIYIYIYTNSILVINSGYYTYIYGYVVVHAGLQAFEIMAIAAVGNNLITYVMNEMHFSLSHSANIVTNFVGTIFLLALLGGFLSDSYLGSFWTILIFGFLELSVRISFHFNFQLINL